jgi:hypothetical protein
MSDEDVRFLKEKLVAVLETVEKIDARVTHLEETVVLNQAEFRQKHEEVLRKFDGLGRRLG